uniref:D-xylose 1-dehydrogenase (NADP(+), D-xylono-1,5-lactone-forming) n=1 Tax=Arcella intermedia TaxID=1963864 RepID=A0A6B2L834_9EUKA|eukprot:TRINITY_DN3475_c0_g1_i1.p1 TRINITY_DN3475_c0_g1~~TRINITY_DN3475_c0_g1_i1.p1  ORF type:complete len:364 (-),score=99.27 TRINITY_DN3475_c0_g1_i1:96-1160(-)
MPSKCAGRARIGVLGAANIAKTALVDPMAFEPNGEIVAIAARDPAKALQWAKENHIPQVYDSYEKLLGDPDIDAVYIPLPNSLHYQWAKLAIESGKHVLCEKPLTSNAEEAEALSQVLLGHPNIVFFEAFHYRHHPAILNAKRAIQQELGPLQSLHVELDVPALFLPGDLHTDIRFQAHLAGGATMDLGCYAVNAIRYFGGEIEEVTSATPTLSERDKNIDLAMKATFKLAGGGSASFSCGFLAKLVPSMEVRVVGEKGKVSVLNFIRPDLLCVSTVSLGGEVRRDVNVDTRSTYSYQLREFCGAVVRAKEGKDWREGCRVLMGIEESIANMKVIDSIYQKASMAPRMKYPSLT